MMKKNKIENGVNLTARRNIILKNLGQKTRCLKITEKVSFNIASGQKLIKNAKNGPIWRVFET